VEGRLSESDTGVVVGGRLYVVSTPIGNMGDFSFRAAEVLRRAGLILAEDTRHSKRLLDRYEIRTPLSAYHEHNEARATPGIVAKLQAGETIALISDAGTPLLSDPGARLVRACVAADIPVVPVPGASAMLAALVASGLDASRFTFYGFLPRKGRDRKDLVSEVARLPHTAVLYEAPGRVADTLAELAAGGAGARDVVVARELTKQFEEVRRGTVDELAAYYQTDAPRGEVVIIVGGGQPEVVGDDLLLARARALGAEGHTPRDVASALVRELGASRNAAYRAAQDVARESGGDE
jgi:16S rRNA (cytidine1402-2'-O)-methyltransferase